MTITETGVVQVNDEVVKLRAAARPPREGARATDDKTVILRGDRKVVLEQAVYVLDQAQLAGAEGFALATKKPKKKP